MLLVDSIVLGAILFFAVTGAITGASRQLGNFGAIAAGGAASRFLTQPWTPHVRRALDLSPGVAALVTAALLFAGASFLARKLLTRFLEQVLVGKDSKDRAPDRWLGFLLGGLKAGVGCYLVMSAFVFLQEDLSLTRHRAQWVSHQSWAYQWAKAHPLASLTSLKLPQ